MPKYQIPGFAGKKTYRDYQEAKNAAKNVDDIEVVLSVAEYNQLVSQIKQLGKEKENLKYSHEREMNTLRSSMNAKISELEKREKGLREAVGRHAKKAGKEEKDKPFRETFDGRKHRVHVELPLAENTPHQEAYEFAEAELKINGNGYYALKEVIRSGQKWQAIYQN